MKKIIICISIISSVLFSFCGNATDRGTAGNVQVSDTGSAQIVFNEYEHHFGKVKEGEKISYTFTFENKGTADLVISSAKTTCGCTVPKFDKKPIHPGKKGNLEVVFDTSGRSGMQTKTITVSSNASKPVILLKITAEVTDTK